MSRPTFQRSMAGIALLAMLAFALLPSVGRIDRGLAAATGGTSAIESTFGAVCTTRGLAYDTALALDEALGFALEDAPKTPSPHDDADCDYCTLAAATALAGVIAMPMAPPPAADDTAGRILTLPSRHHPNGLGSRGPPA
jgi:hypothetical protein